MAKVTVKKVPVEKVVKTKPEDVDSAVAKSGLSDYDKDPDKGERPYKDYEVKDMAHHVGHAMDILSHPVKRKAVMKHFSKEKANITNFEQLSKKIGSDMDK